MGWLAAKAGSQRNDALDGGCEQGTVEGSVVEAFLEREPGPFTLVEALTGAQDQVHSGVSRQRGAPPGRAERLQRPGLQRVGNRDAGEAEPLAQFAADDGG